MSVSAAGTREMRQRAEWMVPKDDPILEVLRDEGNLTPLAISREGERSRVSIGRQWASDRCNKLHRYGLLTRVDKGLYAISDQGRAYLDEELDASTLDPIE